MSNKHKAEKHSIWQFRITEYLIYFLAFALPLSFSTKHFYAFNSPKVLLAITAVLLMTIFYLWGKWQSDNFKIKISLLSLATVFFGLVLTISSLAGIDPVNSFFGWGNVMPLVAIYALIAFAFITGALIKKNERIVPRLLSAIFISGIFTMIFFYTGLPSPVGRSDGSTLGNSSYMGGFLIFVTFFGLALFFYAKNIWQKIFIALGILFVTINPLFINKEFLLGKVGLGEILNNPMSLLGVANGGAMGIFMSIVLMGVLFLIFSKRKILKIIGFVLAVVLAVGVVYTSRALVVEGTKINKIFTEEKSGNRFTAWDIAQKGYKESPILGNGVNNYIYNFEKYYNTDFYKKDYFVERMLQPHNVIWQFLSDTGVLGLAGYLVLLIGLFATLLYRKNNNEENIRLRNLRIILAASIFGYFLQNLFVFDTINTYLPLFAMVAIGLGLGCGHELSFKEKTKLYPHINKFFILIIIIFSFIFLYKFSYQGLLESKGMNFTNETRNMSEFADLRDGLNKKSPFGGMMEYAYQAEKMLKVYQKVMYQVDEESKPVFLKEIKSLISEMEEVIVEQPNYGASYLTMSGILNIYLLTEGKEGGLIKINKDSYNKEVWDKSFLYVNKAIEINNKNPINYNVLSQLYMIKGDMDNAFLYAKEYVKLAPEYEEAYKFGRGLLRIRQNFGFEQYLNEMEGKHIK